MHPHQNLERTAPPPFPGCARSPLPCSNQDPRHAESSAMALYPQLGSFKAATTPPAAGPPLTEKLGEGI